MQDSNAIFAYRSDPEVVRFQIWKPKQEAEVRQFIREQQGFTPGLPGIWFQFSIIRQADAVLIGDCGIHVPLDSVESAEVGLTLSASYQGLGYATESLNALLHFCFTTLQLHRVFARTAKLNIRSIALIRRTDFQPASAEQFELSAPDDEFFFVMERRAWENKELPAGEAE
jgi:RimJ/RimL family protein N-acetyltransferase